MAASDPARNLSLSAARRGEVSCRCSRTASRPRVHRRLVPGRDVRASGSRRARRRRAAAAGRAARARRARHPSSRRSRRRAGAAAGAPRAASARRTARTRSSARPRRMTRSESRSNSRMRANRSGPSRSIDCEQALRARGDVRVGVDLPVRVGERDADRLAAVLEREHLLDAGQRRQRGRCGRPTPRSPCGRGSRVRVPNEPACSGLKHTTSQRPTDVRVRPRPGASRSSRPRGGSIAGRGVAVRLGESRAERRRLVLEDGDVVARRDLGRVRRRLRRERVELGRRAGTRGSGGRRRPRSSRR